MNPEVSNTKINGSYQFDSNILEMMFSLPDVPPITEDEVTLANREKESSSRLCGGSSRTDIIKLKDDGMGIFKPKSGEWIVGRMQGYIESGSMFKREVAAFLVDKFLEFGLVPATVFRSLDGEVGSFQKFISDTEYYRAITLEERETFYENIKKMFLFDLIIWNGDRHRENFVVSNYSKIFAIDHGHSFGTRGSDLRVTDTVTLSSTVKKYCLLYRDTTIPDDAVRKITDVVSGTSSRLNSLEITLKTLVGEESAIACIKRIKFLGKVLQKNNGILPDGLVVEYEPGV